MLPRITRTLGSRARWACGIGGLISPSFEGRRLGSRTWGRRICACFASPSFESSVRRVAGLSGVVAKVRRRCEGVEGFVIFSVGIIAPSDGIWFVRWLRTLKKYKSMCQRAIHLNPTSYLFSSCSVCNLRTNAHGEDFYEVQWASQRNSRTKALSSLDDDLEIYMETKLSVRLLIFLATKVWEMVRLEIRDTYNTPTCINSQITIPILNMSDLAVHDSPLKTSGAQ